MLTERKDAAVDAITRAALQSAESAKQANFIRIEVISDEEVRLTMLLAGDPKTWINYDGEQLDELIRMLQMYRREIA